MPFLTKAYIFCLLLFPFFLPALLRAQSVENTINLYGTNFPQEKIHIHFDKEAYLPGETIWFKAYIFEEDVPSARSTNFYTALYDEEGKLIQQQLYPIFNATANGHFDIPDSLQGKQIICRAYTIWMQNFDTSFLFTKAIKLLNNNSKPVDAIQKKTVSLQFFPEGGDIIEGCLNTIAFKANYNNGLPFEINGTIKKQETGEIIMPLQSVHDGMGRFDIDVQPKEKYYAEWIDNNGNKQQTYFPDTKATGVSLKLIIQKNNLVYNIINRSSNDSLHVLMYMYQKVFYNTDIEVSNDEPYTGIVPIGDLPSGTMQLTLFNAAWQPVAERVVFINNNNFTLNTSINNKEISTQKRGKNIIEIEVTDTIPANMSLSITDAALNSEISNSNIVTNLLLGGDVKGFINNPAYYFSSNTDAVVKANLDLVMLTHGWRRYNWDNVLAGKMPVINYAADDYLSIYGQVGKPALQKIDSNELVNLIVKTKDNMQNFYFAKPNTEGLLKQTGLVFYDSAKVLYSFNKNKTYNPQLTLNASNYTYNQPNLIHSISYQAPDTSKIEFNQTASLFGYYIKDSAAKRFNKEKTLQGVIVKSGGWHNWKNDPMFLLDQKYTSGLFRNGSNAEAFDVLHDEMAAAKMDVINYIGYQSRLVGVDNRYGGKKLKVGVGPPLIGPSYPPIIFIDESVVDASALQTLSITDVAYIKIIYPYLGIRDENGNLTTAVSIYLKKGEDRFDKSPKDTDLKFVKIAGYSPLKEFYAPDYSQSNTGMGTDARSTLLWQPYILTDSANRKIPITFYNNDLSKKLRLVLEGINDAGKMIHIEKIIE